MSSNASTTSSRTAGATIVSLEISGMRCGHCAAAVRSALHQVPGLRGGDVAIGAARLAIDPAAGSADATTTAAIAAIRDAGYDARVSGCASGARASSPSVGLPVMGGCCSPRAA